MFESLTNFNNMFSSATDSGDATYTNSELLGAYKDLSYLECRDIYRYWPLGKRIVSSLPRFAMSAQRKFIIKNAPEVVNAKLTETASLLDIDNIVMRTAIYARIYGLASLYIANKKNPKEPLTYEDVQNGEIVFNALDPLAMGGGIQVDNNPLSQTFSKPISVTIQGRAINPARIAVIYNDIPLYYKFNPASFAFSGPSIYQNMTLLIRSWNRCIIALQRLATKASAIIKTSKDNANITGFNINAVQKNLALIRSIENDGIASIRQGDTLEFFSLTGVSEVDNIINQLNTGLMLALADTPSGILLDKNLSVGLNDGTEDMKAILMAVEHFRLAIIKPLYVFTDKFLCYKAFSQPFILQVKNDYPELYRELSLQEILSDWLQNYTFEWGDLYPQSENERTESQARVLDNLTKIKEMGAGVDSLEEALNQLDFFNVEFSLEKDYQHDFTDDENALSFGDLENEND